MSPKKKPVPKEPSARDKARQFARSVPKPHVAPKAETPPKPDKTASRRGRTSQANAPAHGQRQPAARDAAAPGGSAIASDASVARPDSVGRMLTQHDEAARAVDAIRQEMAQWQDEDVVTTEMLTRPRKPKSHPSSVSPVRHAAQRGAGADPPAHPPSSEEDEDYEPPPAAAPQPAPKAAPRAAEKPKAAPPPQAAEVPEEGDAEPSAGKTQANADEGRAEDLGLEQDATADEAAT